MTYHNEIDIRDFGLRILLDGNQINYNQNSTINVSNYRTLTIYAHVISNVNIAADLNFTATLNLSYLTLR